MIEDEPLVSASVSVSVSVSASVSGKNHTYVDSMHKKEVACITCQYALLTLTILLVYVDYDIQECYRRSAS